ncbi:MAG: DNA mismatch repair protein MutS, partial [Psychroflexus sp.]
MLRLLVFVLVAFAVYQFWSSTRIVIGAVLIGVILFVVLVTRHSNIQYKKAKLKALIDLNQTEIKILNREFADRPTGENYKDSLHEFSQDIDIFGKHSFFQYLNRTSLKEGESGLAKMLTANNTEHIELKQDAIKDLAELIDFRQDFSADAKLVDTETPAASIVNWITNYKSFVPKMMSWFPIVFSVLSAGVISIYFLNYISGAQLLLWFIIGLVISGIYLKKVNALSGYVSKAQSTFQQYFKLLNIIENADFSSDLLKTYQDKIKTESATASQTLKQFSKHIDALDQRNNFLLGIFLNGFMLRDLTQALKIENWIALHADQVKNWFEVIAQIDALNSLGNFAFNHKNYVFPEIKSGDFLTKTRGAVHPLIDPEDAVTN